ncbi:MAB_1171c family putative transporter [Streptomyces sp. NPDC001404]|uniref:MAB_1171c family putative transporter n=1 Tax=Streptomyces sp. NPDC001404 TaxID=3364571 RepID=UPI0036BF2BB8
MTLVAIWRAMGGRDASRRSLWGCFLGFGIALWTKTRIVRIGLNNSAITDLSVLIKHYSAGIAILAIMYYIVAVYGQDTDRPRAVQVTRLMQIAATKSAMVAIGLMTLMFFTIVDRSVPSDHFVSDHAGQPGATAYMTVFYIYLGSASALCLYQWSSAFLGEKRPLLKTGLGLMSAAMLLGVLYSWGRMFFMWGWLVQHPEYSFAHEVESITEAMQLALFVLFAIGVSIPTTQESVRRARSWFAMARLYPMWRQLMAAFPEIPMEKPGTLRHELTRRDLDIELHLDRWIHDVSDAIEKLRHYVPDELLPAAKEAAAAQHRRADAGPLAQAYWITAALAAKANGTPAGPVAAFEQRQAVDQDDEAAWLCRVARAHKKADPQRAEALLASLSPAVTA